MTVKAIVFDIGGVLDKGDWKNHYFPLCNEIGIDFEEFSKAYHKYAKDATIGKISSEKFIELIAKELNVNSKKLMQIWIKTKKKVLSENLEVRDMILKLKNNYKIASLTNIIELHHKMRIELNLYDIFDFNICSCIEGVCKPDIKIYKLLLSKLKKTKPEEIIFIDDKEECLTPADSLGIKTILFKDNAQLIEDLKKLGVKI